MTDDTGTVAEDEENRNLTKGERTRRLLIEIAIEQFGKHGYRGTSVSEITRAAGLTQAASYAYFPSKEALYSEAVNADAAALARFAQERTATTPVRRLLPEFLVHLVTALDDHPLVRRILSGEEPEGFAHLRGLSTIDSTRGGLAARIADGQRRGEVRTDIDPESIAIGAHTITLALLMSIARARTSPRSSEGESSRIPDNVILGVVSALDAMLKPPDPSPNTLRVNPTTKR